MRRWVMQGAIVAWALAATIVAVQASTLARSVKETDKGQTKVELELATLEAEHEALVEWVDEELEPWTEEVAEVVEPSPGKPSPANLPSLPPVPSEVPSPEPPLVPTPTPSVDLGPSVVPTPEPTPSICLPIICEGSASP